MKTCKRMVIFLLLGVMLVGLLICGCTPVEQTQASTSEPDPNAIAFLDLPCVNMDDIDKISIYYGSADNRELMQTLDSAEAIAEFQATFEQFRFTKIDKYDDMFSTSSEGIYYTEEYTEATQHIDTAHCIYLQLCDGTQWGIYVGTNKLVYYVTPQGTIYLSVLKTEYIDAILKN